MNKVLEKIVASRYLDRTRIVNKTNKTPLRKLHFFRALHWGTMSKSIIDLTGKKRIRVNLNS